ncbi:MAG: DEAD/DEAH box helicase family protein [Clostridium sp.]|nr:DEAD/DEAH box helicase family protein [Clostridium sp.]
MKFNFKIQQYQTDAVDAVVKVFQGQGYHDRISYIRDVGKRQENQQMRLNLEMDQQYSLDTDGERQLNIYDIDDDDTGYKNEVVELTDDQLLMNIQKIQSQNNIKQSPNLVKDLGRCSLDIEMETGTGKTYVYIKTMFELNKKYGWSKFIVVVPSIAIREGVKKTFEITADHFMEYYGKKARFFIYNSSNLNQLDNFSSSSGINVMIINTQAFASSLKEDGRSKEARIIYSKRDEFGSRRPIDVIKANRPIIILDEPQKMGGAVTQKALKNFNPLFTLNYSATHAVKHNTVYVLDALDAFNKRLVKKIEVKGFEVKNFRGTDSYMFLEQIVLSSKKPPMARIELEIGYNKSINRETRVLGVDDNLYYVSQGMEQYKGYTISDIDPFRGTVTFTNGEVIKTGEVSGDVSESDMRRIQIRETILSHFEKEEKLFNMGIKSLSLFFIDEVSKYRQYDTDGNEILGEYGRIFEEEYLNVLNDYITVFDTPYQKYLKSMCSDVSTVHKGYFSIDKKTGRSIDSQLKRGSEFSDDISAYDLILKNKERLLSFDEPTRFIFSHSALREGWDNPNVFQICTLKHSDSQTAKRQEVGRGLRLCVNQHGNRMDAESCGDSVHDINMLTVIASESYKGFVADLQSDIKTILYDRPTAATSEYFKGKYVKVDGTLTLIDSSIADVIEFYLISNGYVDMKRKVTDKYRADVKMGTVAPLPEEIQPMAEGIHTLIQAVYDDSVLKDMFSDGHETKVKENPLNENFAKAEFQALWKQINHKYAYTVEFDSAELIRKSIAHINEKLFVSELQYTTTIGRQKSQMDEYEISRGDSFVRESSGTYTLSHVQTSQIKYDLIGKIAEGTVLTRKTAAAILKGLRADKLYMFKNNPEEFISKVVKLIKEQKATMIVEHISYNQIEGEYDSSIFTAEKSAQTFDKAFRANKAIQDYVFTDGLAEKSIERRFVEDLDAAQEVCVYAKLPKGFHIPTPVGNYSPDWAIAFYEGTVKHIFFIAETKGTMDSLNLKPIEQAKISCAKKLFNEMSTSNVKYHDVDSYQNLLNVMKSL